MRIVSCLALFTLALSAALAGCVAGDPGADPAPDGDFEQETGDVGEAEQALVTCHGETCNGVLVGDTNCDADAYNVSGDGLINSPSGAIGKVVLRYSPSCNALWARTVSLTLSNYYISSGIKRPSGVGVTALTGNADSLSPVNAFRSPMVGLKSGVTYTGTGKLGFSYGNYAHTGTISRSF